MKIRSILTSIFLAAFAGGLFCLTSCENGNIFGGIHDRGDSGDTKALLNDADQALRGGDYSQALSLYNRVLAADPDNAQALYGSGAALLGTAGLNIGVLVTNILKQAPGSSSINGVGDLISDSRLGFSAASDIDPNSILFGVGRDNLSSVIDLAICRLQKIVAGVSDGSISPNNTDVLVNLAILFIIRAALRPINAGYLDVTNVGGDYEVIDKTGGTQAAFCSNADHQALVKDMAKDVASAYALFNRAVLVLGLGSDRLITQLRNDVGRVMEIILDPTQGLNLDVTCRNLITNDPPGITLSNYQNYDDVFNPPSGC